MIINSSLPCIIDCDDGTEIARGDYFVPTMRDSKGTKRALFRGRPLEGVTETNLNMFLIKEDKANPGTLKVHCYNFFNFLFFLDPAKKVSINYRNLLRLLQKLKSLPIGKCSRF